jgi:hypothetical protein
METYDFMPGREGNTLRELGRWLRHCQNDESLQTEAGYIESAIESYKNQEVDELDTLRSLYQRYYATDGSVSENASTILLQSTMWFGFEADIDQELDMEISRQEAEKVTSSKESFNQN